MHSYGIMLIMPKKPLRQFGVIILALIGNSFLASSLLALRFIYSEHLTYAFLLWNLLLAWIPLLCALAMYSWHTYHPNSYIQLGLLGAIWLLFFPNAPYIVTDMLHIFYLGTANQVPLWYDIIILLSFALNGLWLGFISLFIVEEVCSRILSPVVVWLIMTLVLFLASFGIYLGRFLRWNSWDILNIIGPIGHLTQPRTVVFTLSYFAVLFSTYVTFRALMTLRHSTDTELH